MEMENCIVCKEKIVFVWTDLHGEGTCMTCGTPYQIIQYSKTDNKRLEGVEPKINIKEEYISHLIEYWDKTKKHMGLGSFFDNPHLQNKIDFMLWLEKHYAEAVKKRETSGEENSP